MASKREQVIEAVVALIAAALPDADVKRNLAKPSSIPPGGLVIIRDGDPGQASVDLSPLAYNYEHRIPLEFAGFESGILTREQVLDTLLVTASTAVSADRFLGGLCQFLEMEAASTDDIETFGADADRWADTAIIASYATTDPNN